MEMLADRILELLNYSERDPEFHKFVSDLEGSLVSKYQKGALCSHIFSELGVILFSAHTRLFAAHFSLRPFQAEGILVSAYRSPLPFGVALECKADDVRQLLGAPKELARVSAKEQSEAYDLPPWNVVFWYLMPEKILRELRVMNPENTK